MRDRPHFIARGLAVGVFAGCFPIPAMQTLFGVLLAILFRGSKFVAAAGTWISNPFTFAPLYALNFKVGQWVLNRHDLPPVRFNYQSLGDLGDLGSDILTIFFTGCLVVGLISALFSYFFGLWFVNRLHQRQRRKLS